jgi:hypothetical protein
MTENLFAAERRFEVRALYVFAAFLMVTALVAVLNFDWWLLSVCIISSFLTGLIGQNLRKNRHKTLAQLQASSTGEPSDAPNLFSHPSLASSGASFTVLVCVSIGSMAFVLGQSWITILGATVGGFFIASILQAISRVKF